MYVWHEHALYPEDHNILKCVYLYTEPFKSFFSTTEYYNIIFLTSRHWYFIEVN
jgi:hypothetical protein